MKGLHVENGRTLIKKLKTQINRKKYSVLMHWKNIIKTTFSSQSSVHVNCNLYQIQMAFFTETKSK